MDMRARMVESASTNISIIRENLFIVKSGIKNMENRENPIIHHSGIIPDRSASNLPIAKHFTIRYISYYELLRNYGNIGQGSFSEYSLRISYLAYDRSIKYPQSLLEAQVC